MASTPVQFYAPTGLSLTLELYPHGSDVIANGAGDTCTEKTNAKGLYEATVTEALSGLHDAVVKLSGTSIANYHVSMADDTSVHRCGDWSVGGEAVEIDASDVWSYATRTLTQSAASVAAAVSGSTITVYRGDTLSISLTGLGSLVGRSKLWFSVKGDLEQADAKAQIRIEESAGLEYINGAAAQTAANGSIVVTDATTGALTITLKAVELAKLPPATSMTYDVQMLNGSAAVTTKTAGTFNIRPDVTRATS